MAVTTYVVSKTLVYTWHFMALVPQMSPHNKLSGVAGGCPTFKVQKSQKATLLKILVTKEKFFDGQ